MCGYMPQVIGNRQNRKHNSNPDNRLMQLDIEQIRKQYPILNREIEGNKLVYLDNAATSQTPQCVVDAITDMYFNHKANVHRGVHTLSQEATDRVEHARERVRALSLIHI